MSKTLSEYWKTKNAEAQLDGRFDPRWAPALAAAAEKDKPVGGAGAENGI
jgi:hypothetical protein